MRSVTGCLPKPKRAVDKRELKLAVDLIERMKGSFDHSAYHDRYRERLMAIIDKKRKGQTITVPEVEERKAPRRSPGRTRGEPGGGGRAEQGEERRPARPKRRSRVRRQVEVIAVPSPRPSSSPWRSSSAVFALREGGLWLLLYPLYLLTREGAIGSPAAALRHAREIVAAERFAGLAVEDRIQRVATLSPLVRDAFAAYYEWAFYPLLACVVIWLGIAHRDVYRRTRRALIVALALAAIVFLLFPTAPPRMLPGLGIHDTVGMHDHDVGSFHGISYNPYAAMPSMHVGWSLIVAGGVIRAVRSPWLRGIAVAHPLVMATATIATGNHYLLDCVAGAGIGLLAILAAGTATSPKRSYVRAPAVIAGSGG